MTSTNSAKGNMHGNEDWNIVVGQIEEVEGGECQPAKSTLMKKVEQTTESFVKKVCCRLANDPSQEYFIDVCLLKQSLLFTRQWDIHSAEMKRRMKKKVKRETSKSGGGTKAPDGDTFVFHLPDAVDASLVPDIIDWLQEHDDVYDISIRSYPPVKFTDFEKQFLFVKADTAKLEALCKAGFALEIKSLYKTAMKSLELKKLCDSSGMGIESKNGTHQPLALDDGKTVLVLNTESDEEGGAPSPALAELSSSSLAATTTKKALTTADVFTAIENSSKISVSPLCASSGVVKLAARKIHCRTVAGVDFFVDEYLLSQSQAFVRAFDEWLVGNNSNAINNNINSISEEKQQLQKSQLSNGEENGGAAGGAATLIQQKKKKKKNRKKKFIFHLPDCIDAECFNDILRWFEAHDGLEHTTDRPADPFTGHRAWFRKNDFEKKFFDVDLNKLIDYLNASHFLQIKSLSDYSCQTMANLFRSRSPEEVRELLQLPNDLDSTDVARIQRRSRRMRMKMLLNAKSAQLEESQFDTVLQRLGFINNGNNYRGNDNLALMLAGLAQQQGVSRKAAAGALAASCKNISGEK